MFLNRNIEENSSKTLLEINWPETCVETYPGSVDQDCLNHSFWGKGATFCVEFFQLTKKIVTCGKASPCSSD